MKKIIETSANFMSKWDKSYVAKYETANNEHV